MVSPGNPFILGPKGLESKKGCRRRGSLHSCECWILLVLYLQLDVDEPKWDGGGMYLLGWAGDGKIYGN